MFGEDDGKIQITLSGGTLPYNSFSWVGPNIILIQHKIYTHYMPEIIPLQQQMITAVQSQKVLVNQSTDISIGTTSIEYVKCKGDNMVL